MNLIDINSRDVEQYKIMVLINLLYRLLSTCVSWISHDQNVRGKYGCESIQALREPRIDSWE